MFLMIDNYDSFTFNLVQYIQQLGHNIMVKRNDEISLSDIAELSPEKIIISPGPCSPNEAGISLQLIDAFAGKIPILGVCLGHQSIAQQFGASIVNAKEIMHGKTSDIYHSCDGVFQSIPSPFTATRYHSLAIDPASLPDCFTVTAWCRSAADSTVDNQQFNANHHTIMAIKHNQWALEGVQFHPESIMTEHGHKLLENFLLDSGKLTGS
ncbi:MAG: aminodeoxychorismate/anthranilate synthase component II [Kangiellaceae bacterium]|jgi:anthranilate synthase component 2|nr:aminodeoxychorismate/anthranilate synthase component II [Kangiellaceae bacterium]